MSLGYILTYAKFEIKNKSNDFFLNQYITTTLNSSVVSHFSMFSQPADTKSISRGNVLQELNPVIKSQ